MEYFLFMDESGDHGLSNIDPSFPVFVLCGILFRRDHYLKFNEDAKAIKQKYWGREDVIFHSVDIRKNNKDFAILFDKEVQAGFIQDMNTLLSNAQYTVISSVIHKPSYIHKYGKLQDNIYEIALSFIVERTVFCLDGHGKVCQQLKIVIEQRGKKVDNKLIEHFQRIRSRGTGFVEGERLRNYNMGVFLRPKRANINGLQLADLAALRYSHFIGPECQ